MRPIVYEELKVGDEVITRGGVVTGKIIATDVNDPKGFVIAAVLTGIDGDQRVECFRRDGHNIGDAEGDWDIFLPTKKEYVNLYRSNERGTYFAGRTCRFKKDCELNNAEFGYESHVFIKTIEVEL